MKTLVQNENAASPARVANAAEPAWTLPAVNIYETKEAYVLEAEMPGVSKKGLEVTLENNELTIVGHRDTTPVKPEWLYRESKPAEFRRSFELDPAIDTAQIAARIDQGLVTLTLPKAERIKPRKISVT